MNMMCNMFTAFYNKMYSAIRNLQPHAKGGIFFALIIGALLCFIYAVKGSKKEKMIKNWFLFFVSILLTILSVAFSFFLGH